MGNKFLALRKSEVAKVAPDRSALMGKLNQEMADRKEIREADERWLRLLFREPYEAKFQSEGTGSAIHVYDGNGDEILTYDKVGPEYVINEARAKTVRKIFDMYLAGNGSQKIKKQLEKDSGLTAMGKSLWHYATISHILKNRLYCGELEYRKEYVPDYLEQKRVKNNGELDRIIVEGKHQSIVTKEEFEKVQKLIEEKRPQMEKCRKNKGIHSDDFWRRKSCRGGGCERQTGKPAQAHGTAAHVGGWGVFGGRYR